MFYDSTERRKEIFDDTMRLCRDNKRLAESVKSSINRTIIYPANNDPFIKDGRKGNNSEITVTAVYCTPDNLSNYNVLKNMLDRA